jgi:methyl-accepting chemotaxis protein
MQDAAGGDFSYRVKIEPRRDELGTLSESFIKVQDSFKELVNHSLNSAKQLAESSMLMNNVTEKTNQGVSQQYAETELLASAIEELATTIQEVASNAAETLEFTNETNKQIDKGNNMMVNTIKAIQNVSDDMNKAGTVIAQLELDVKQIDTILSVIRNISEQTNLLALNAAIEAARAGETGRGFAVVADEVRSLAQRTHESTEEIQSMTEALQAAASNAVKVMHDGKKHIQKCVENAHETGECLELAASKVIEVNDRNNMIATTVEQQGIVANEVSQNVLAIKGVAEETFNGAKTLSSNSQKLQQLSQKTEQVLSKYKV